jgi:predicted GNAT family acetyltransferase
VRAQRLDDGAVFLAEAGPLLLADEARHNLVLGIAGTTVSAPAVYPDRSFWLVRDGAAVVAAALRTAPYNLALAQPRDEAALAALVDGIEAELPGVTGALPEVDAFAERWCARHGCTPRVELEQRLLALRQLAPVPRARGSARRAGEEDAALVVDWWRRFVAEALPHEPAPDERRIVEHRLRAPGAGIVLWEDGGEVVSLCGYGGATPNGIRIGPVYTPPELRGRGYATTLTADVSARLLAEGRTFCFLYTDLANPTSNAIYERIGYVRVCDGRAIAFD